MIDRRGILKSAWQIFREWRGKVKLSPRFRNEFARCLAIAWERAKEAARLAACPMARIQARIDRLTVEIDRNQYRRWTPELSTETRNMQIELEGLAAQIAA